MNSEGQHFSTCSRDKMLGSWVEFWNSKLGDLHFVEKLMTPRYLHHQNHLCYWKRKVNYITYEKSASTSQRIHYCWLQKTSPSVFFTYLNFVSWENHTELSDPFAKTNVIFWYQWDRKDWRRQLHCNFSWNVLHIISGSGSSVGTATDYGLNSPRSNPGRDEIFRPSRPGLVPIQFPVKWVPGLSLGVKCGRGVLLTNHPLLVPRSWKSRAIPLPTLWATPGL